MVSSHDWQSYTADELEFIQHPSTLTSA